LHALEAFLKTFKKAQKYFNALKYIKSVINLKKIFFSTEFCLYALLQYQNIFSGYLFFISAPNLH